MLNKIDLTSLKLTPEEMAYIERANKSCPSDMEKVVDQLGQQKTVSIKTQEQLNTAHKNLFKFPQFNVENFELKKKEGEITVITKQVAVFGNRYTTNSSNELIIPLVGDADLPASNEIVQIKTLIKEVLISIESYGVGIANGEPCIRQGSQWIGLSSKKCHLKIEEMALPLPIENSKIKDGNLVFIFGGTKAMLLPILLKDRFFNEFIKGEKKHYNRLGGTFTGSVSLFKISKALVFVDSNGNIAELKNADGSTFCDGTGVFIAENCKPLIEEGTGHKIEIEELKALVGNSNQARDGDGKLQGKFVELPYVNYLINIAKAQGLNYKLINCTSLDQVEFVCTKDAYKMGGIKQGESFSFELLAIPHGWRKINTSIQALSQDLNPGNVPLFAQFLAGKTVEKMTSVATDSNLQLGLPALINKGVMNSNPVQIILADKIIWTAEQKISAIEQIVLERGALNSPVTQGRVKKQVLDVAKKAVSTFNIKVEGFSGILQGVPAPILNWSQNTRVAECWNSKLGKIVDMRKSLLKWVNSPKLTTDKKAFYQGKLFAIESKYVFDIEGRVISKGVKYPASQKGGSATLAFIGKSELESRVKGAVLADMLGLHESVVQIPQFQSLWNVLAGADFDWDHISVYTEPFIVQMHLDAVENYKSVPTDVDCFKEGGFEAIKKLMK